MRKEIYENSLRFIILIFVGHIGHGSFLKERENGRKNSICQTAFVRRGVGGKTKRQESNQ
jgi:hypothetical protein